MGLPPDPAPRPAVPVALCLAIGVLGGATVLYATSLYGPNVAGDALDYVACSRSLVEHGRFLRHDGSPMRVFPPLYPILIAGPVLAGMRPDLVGGWINCIAFAGTVALAGLWVWKVARSLPLACGASLAALASRPLVATSVVAGAEPVFNLLVVGFLWSLTVFHRTGSRRSLLWAAGLAALACLQRYVGIVLVGAGCLIILLGQGPFFRRRVARLLVFTGISVVPSVIWLAYSSYQKYQATGTILPVPAPPTRAVLPILGQAGDVALRWFVPLGPAAPRPIGTVFLLLLGAGILVWFAWQARSRLLRPSAPSEGLPVATYAAAYLLMIVVALSRGRWGSEGPTDRYLSPIYVPLGWVICGILARCGIGAVRAGTGPSSRRWGGMAVAAVFAAWLAASAWAMAPDVLQWAANGAGGFNQRKFRESPTLARINAQDWPGPLLTNRFDLVYYLGRHPAIPVPAPQTAQNQAAMNEWARSHNLQGPGPEAVLAWFKDYRPEECCGLEDLRRLLELDTVADLPDGTICRVRWRGPATAATATRPE